MIKWKFWIYDSFPFSEGQYFLLDGDESENMEALWSGGTIDGTVQAPLTMELDISVLLPVPEAVSVRSLEKRAMAIVDEAAVTRSNFFLYWIRSAKRINNTTALIKAHMDVLNSGGYALSLTAEGSSAISPKTMIIREHRDRFVRKAVSVGDVTLSDKVDRISEGISPRQFKTRSKVIQEVNGPALKYYLIYRTSLALTAENISNPVSCFMVASSPLLISAGSSGSAVTLYPTSLIGGKYYYLTQSSTNSAGSVTTSGGASYSIGGTEDSATIVGMIIFKYSESSVSLTRILRSGTETSYTLTLKQTVNLTYVRLNVCKSVYLSDVYSNEISLAETSGTLQTYNAGTTSDVYCKSISSVDRTDARILKIIELPYSPVEFSVNSGVWTFTGFSFVQSEGMLRLSSLDTGFGHQLNLLSESPVFYGLRQSVAVSAREDMIQAARFIVDPKIYSSEFSTHKIVYDTFSVETKAEAIINSSDSAVVESYYFKPTSTINSNSAIKSALNQDVTYIDESDFGRYLLSTRNNELTVFSNDYINYIRTGYNYDKKSKAISTASAWLGAAGTVATAAIGAAVNPAVGAAAAVGAVMTVKSAISTTITNENTMASKLTSLRNQSTSTSGTDDVDLLNFYCQDKAIMMEYQPSKEIKQLLDDLFYYFGYNTNVLGVPSFHSRTWFNFVQANLVFNGSAYDIPAPILEEIRNKFSEGVTLIHRIAGWSEFGQTRENYETWLVPSA